MNTLNQKQWNFLSKIRNNRVLQAMPDGLADFTEGDDEQELLSTGNMWYKHHIIDVVDKVLKENEYSDAHAKRLNALAIYYRKHYLE
jgi:hypothetical protein